MEMINTIKDKYFSSLLSYQIYDHISANRYVISDVLKNRIKQFASTLFTDIVDLKYDLMGREPGIQSPHISKITLNSENTKFFAYLHNYPLYSKPRTYAKGSIKINQKDNTIKLYNIVIGAENENCKQNNAAYGVIERSIEDASFCLGRNRSQASLKNLIKARVSEMLIKHFKGIVSLTITAILDKWIDDLDEFFHRTYRHAYSDESLLRFFDAPELTWIHASSQILSPRIQDTAVMQAFIHPAIDKLKSMILEYLIYTDMYLHTDYSAGMFRKLPRFQNIKISHEGCLHSSCTLYTCFEKSMMDTEQQRIFIDTYVDATIFPSHGDTFNQSNLTVKIINMLTKETKDQMTFNLPATFKAANDLKSLYLSLKTKNLKSWYERHIFKKIVKPASIYMHYKLALKQEYGNTAGCMIKFLNDNILHV
jgi:hypothetical protein